MKTVQQYNVGTTFRVSVIDPSTKLAADLTGASAWQLWLQPPHGPGRGFAAILSGTAAQGKIEYTTQAGDLDQFGIWEIQGKVTFPAGDLFTRRARFTVERNIQPAGLFLRPNPAGVEAGARAPALG